MEKNRRRGMERRTYFTVKKIEFFMLAKSLLLQMITFLIKIGFDVKSSAHRCKSNFDSFYFYSRNWKLFNCS